MPHFQANRHKKLMMVPSQSSHLVLFCLGLNANPTCLFSINCTSVTPRYHLKPPSNSLIWVSCKYPPMECKALQSMLASYGLHTTWSSSMRNSILILVRSMPGYPLHHRLQHSLISHLPLYSLTTLVWLLTMAIYSSVHYPQVRIKFTLLFTAQLLLLLPL